MAKLTAMAPDSAGFRMLMRLHSLGGVAGIAQVTVALSIEFQSRSRFQSVVAKPMEQRGLVRFLTSGQIEITKEGQMLVDAHIRALPSHRDVSTVMPAIDLKKHFRYEERRPGSLEYKAIPSKMGEERIGYSVAISRGNK